jgi:signal transduction histidine kinase
VRYHEFEYIATVYESLRVRLKDSYEKIRSFTANASHELKTPLTILRGGTEKLINSLPLGSTAQIDAQAIGEEIERLITITERLLLLSRADDHSMMMNFAKWDLSTFLDELADDAAEFQRNVKIIKHIAPGVIWHCDPVLAKQLIHNLYTNAAKYNIPNGQIVFALEKRGDNLNLTIENTSADVAIDLPARAFERFYRADAAHNRQVDGMGLGLSICNKIALLHNGVLEMTVSPSSVVTLTLTAPLDASLKTHA